MLTRILTAIVGITIGVIVVLLADTVVFEIAIAVLSFLIVYELLSNCKCLQYKIHSAVCLAYAAALPFLTNFCSINVIYIVAAACTLVMLVGFIAYHKTLSFDKLCFMIASTVLSSAAMSCLVILNRMDETHGAFYVVLCLAAAWLSDGAAYFVGTFCGKHKLCPEISPKKTVEGAVGGVVGNIIILYIFVIVYTTVMHSKGYEFSTNYVWTGIVGLITSLLSMVGDLSASLIKRQNNIKDFGKIMPGHGGVLDRFDSVLVVAPFMALAFKYLAIFN
ncbi:MAG: phosphatidate cytidylyltransferase [Oscillospiraceae bacterium]|nr:phosphatidate cytidylyltransferase [Oscillospiraceae bacterium]